MPSTFPPMNYPVMATPRQAQYLPLLSPFYPIQLSSLYLSQFQFTFLANKIAPCYYPFTPSVSSQLIDVTPWCNTPLYSGLIQLAVLVTQHLLVVSVLPSTRCKQLDPPLYTQIDGPFTYPPLGNIH